jgi:hypothetical protein
MDDSPIILELATIYMNVNWFISMSLFNKLHPIMAYATQLPLFLIYFPFMLKQDAFSKEPIKDFPIKARLAALPSIWFFIAFLGAAFRKKGTLYVSESFMSSVLLGEIIAFICFGVFQLFKNKNWRIFTFFYFVINLYFCLFISFMAGMSISGTWL